MKRKLRQLLERLGLVKRQEMTAAERAEFIRVWEWATSPEGAASIVRQLVEARDYAENQNTLDNC